MLLLKVDGSAQLVISDNTQAHFEMWKETLSQNRSLNQAWDDAYSVIQSRLASISRGMPDLPPKQEQRVMTRAFEIHEKALNTKEYHPGRSGVLTPPWTASLNDVCSCFSTAYAEFLDFIDAGGVPWGDELPVKTKVVEPVDIDPEDLWYDQQRLD